MLGPLEHPPMMATAKKRRISTGTLTTRPFIFLGLKSCHCQLQATGVTNLHVEDQGSCEQLSILGSPLLVLGRTWGDSSSFPQAPAELPHFPMWGATSSCPHDAAEENDCWNDHHAADACPSALFEIDQAFRFGRVFLKIRPDARSLYINIFLFVSLSYQLSIFNLQHDNCNDDAGKGHIETNNEIHRT